jgi:hypothetical protein
MPTKLGLTLLFTLSAIGCAAVDNDGNQIASTAEALATALDIDFSDYPLGPLGSPWTVTTSGSGTARVVASTGHGNVLRIQHGAERDYSISSLPLSYSGAVLEFEFQVQPKSAASTFTLSLSGAKSGYKVPRFALSLVPGSSDLTVSSLGTNPACGKLNYGTWSTVEILIKPKPDTTHSLVDVRINGVLAPGCSGLSSSLRTAKALTLLDSTQPSANSETLFDNFVAQAE